MNQAMPNHFILSLETSATSRTTIHRTIIRPFRRMYVLMRIQKIFCWKRLYTAAGIGALETSDLGVGDTVDTHFINTKRHTCRDRGGLISARFV